MRPNKLPKIFQRNKDLVNGWMKEEIERPHNYRSISAINCLCISFLCTNQDKFIAPKCHKFASKFEVTDTQISVDRFDYLLHSKVYGSNEMSNGIHYWKFYIGDVGYLSRLGIESLSGDEEYSLILSKGNWCGRKNHNAIWIDEDEDSYFSPVRDGQIIEMRLDLDAKKISYRIVNETIFRKAFTTIRSNTYRLMAYVTTFEDLNWTLLEYKMIFSYSSHYPPLQ